MANWPSQREADHPRPPPTDENCEGRQAGPNPRQKDLWKPGHLLPDTPWQRCSLQKIPHCLSLLLGQARRVGGEEGMAENATPNVGPDL